MSADLVTYCGDQYLPLFETTTERLAKTRDTEFKRDDLRGKAIALSRWQRSIKAGVQSAQVSLEHAQVEDRHHNRSSRANAPSGFSLPFLVSPKLIDDPQKHV